MTLPYEHKILGSKNRVVVPIAVLKKGVVRKLDATHSGKSISVLGKLENGRFSVTMVQTAVTELLNLSGEDAEKLRRLLEHVVYANGDEEADSAFASYIEWVEEQVQPSNEDQRRVLAITNNVAAQLARNFILFVELEANAVGTRTTVKYAMNQEAPELDRLGIKQVLFGYEVPDYGFAASHHVEIEVPPGLVLSRMEIREEPNGQPDGEAGVDESASGQRLGHVALSPSSRFLKGRVEVEVVPARQGLLLFTNVAVFCIAAMFGLAQVVRWLDDDVLGLKAEIPSPSASILLIGPALLFSWMSRSPEHNLLVELLSPLRKILVLCALALLGTAVLAAVPVKPMIWDAGWFIIGVLVVGALVALVRYNQVDIRNSIVARWTRVSAWILLLNECHRLAVQCRSIRRHVE